MNLMNTMIIILSLGTLTSEDNFYFKYPSENIDYNIANEKIKIFEQNYQNEFLTKLLKDIFSIENIQDLPTFYELFNEEHIKNIDIPDIDYIKLFGFHSMKLSNFNSSNTIEKVAEGSNYISKEKNMNKATVKLPSGHVIHRGGSPNMSGSNFYDNTYKSNEGSIIPDVHFESNNNVREAQNPQVNLNSCNINPDIHRKPVRQQSPDCANVNGYNSEHQKEPPKPKSQSPIARSRRNSENHRQPINHQNIPNPLAHVIPKNNQPKNHENKQIHNNTQNQESPYEDSIQSLPHTHRNNPLNEKYFENINVSYPNPNRGNPQKHKVVDDSERSSVVNENIEEHLNSPEHHKENILHFSLTKNTEFKNEPVENNISYQYTNSNVTNQNKVTEKPMASSSTNVLNDKIKKGIFMNDLDNLWSRIQFMDGNNPCEISYVNLSSESVFFYWREQNGSDVQTGIIGPNQFQSYNTFTSRSWLLTRQNGQKICIFIPPTSTLQPNSKISLKIEKDFKVNLGESTKINIDNRNLECSSQSLENNQSNYNLTTDRDLSKQLDRINTVPSAKKDLSKRFDIQDKRVLSDSKGFQKANRITTLDTHNNTEPKANPLIQEQSCEESTGKTLIEVTNPNTRSGQIMIQDGYNDIFRSTDKTCEFGKGLHNSDSKNGDHTFGSIMKTNAKEPSKNETNIFGSNFSLENCNSSVDFTRSVNKHQKAYKNPTYENESQNINVPVAFHQEIEQPRKKSEKQDFIVEKRVPQNRRIADEYETCVNINAPIQSEHIVYTDNDPPSTSVEEIDYNMQPREKIVNPVQRSRKNSETKYSNQNSNRKANQHTRVVPSASHGIARPQFIEVEQNPSRVSPTAVKSIEHQQLPVIQSNIPVAAQFNMLMEHALHNNMGHNSSHALLPPQPPKKHQVHSRSNSQNIVHVPQVHSRSNSQNIVHVPQVKHETQTTQPVDLYSMRPAYEQNPIISTRPAHISHCNVNIMQEPIIQKEVIKTHVPYIIHHEIVQPTHVPNIIHHEIVQPAHNIQQNHINTVISQDHYNLPMSTNEEVNHHSNFNYHIHPMQPYNNDPMGNNTVSDYSLKERVLQKVQSELKSGTRSRDNSAVKLPTRYQPIESHNAPKIQIQQPRIDPHYSAQQNMAFSGPTHTWAKPLKITQSGAKFTERDVNTFHGIRITSNGEVLNNPSQDYEQYTNDTTNHPAQVTNASYPTNSPPIIEYINPNGQMDNSGTYGRIIRGGDEYLRRQQMGDEFVPDALHEMLKPFDYSKYSQMNQLKPPEIRSSDIYNQTYQSNKTMNDSQFRNTGEIRYQNPSNTQSTNFHKRNSFGVIEHNYQTNISYANTITNPVASSSRFMTKDTNQGSADLHIKNTVDDIMRKFNSR